MDRFHDAVADPTSLAPRPKKDLLRVTSWLRRSAQLVGASSILAATALASMQLSVKSLVAWPLSVALILPFSLVAMVVIAAMTRILSHRKVLEKLTSDGGEILARMLLLSFVGIVLLVIGGYASNVLFVDEPFSRLTLVGYAVTIVTALLALLLGWRHLRKRRVTGVIGWQSMIVVTLFSGGAALALVDILFLPALYHELHLLIGCSSIVFLSGAALAASKVWPGACGKVTLVVCGTAAVVWVVVKSTDRDMVAAVLREPNAARRALTLIWNATDRDGDGFSSWLGGGDCDDGNPRVHQFSMEGRDCLGWFQLTQATRQESSRPVLSRAVGAPDLVLLLTIDAFRCGFGELDRVELRNACPHLEQLARTGRFLPNAHTPHPDTRAAMNSIMRVQFAGWDPAAPFLPDVLKEVGYNARAIVTHPRTVAIKGLREAFDQVDDTLVPQAIAVGGLTSEGVTDRVLREATAALASGVPTFIWSHYYDPHAPYVKVPGSPFALSSLDGYVAEIRRTDAAIGRLISILRSKVSDGRLVVFVTADHAEEFGEHGASRHGSNLYDTTTRVPFIAWRSGGDAQAGLPKELPINHDEIARYVASTVAGRSFSSSGRTLLWSKNVADPQVAIVHDGWKLLYHQRFSFSELYDLRRDPDEQIDLAREYPEKVQSLGRLLASEYVLRNRR